MNTHNLESLKRVMGDHSNKTIDNILEYEKVINSGKRDEIVSKLSEHIFSFLERKKAIQTEYPDAGDPGDTYAYDNRKSYRNNIRSVIKDLFESNTDKDLSDQIQDTKNMLLEEFNKDD